MARARLVANGFVQGLGVGAAIDDAQDLVDRRKPVGDLAVRLFADGLHADPTHGVEQGRGIGRQLDGILEAVGEGAPAAHGNLEQRGLRRRAQYDRAAIVGGEFLQRRHAGAQQGQRQGLHLVQHDDAAGEVVQLAAL